jgi:hypothetical protein
MPVTMTWSLVSEQAPAHQESIIWLRVRSSFDSYGFEPKEVDVEYVWNGVDGDGYFTGNAVCYEEGDEQQEGYCLIMCVDGYELQPTDLWMSQEIYYKFLEENIPNLAELEGK